jgi:hypothetical protein
MTDANAFVRVTTLIIGYEGNEWMGIGWKLLVRGSVFYMISIVV